MKLKPLKERLSLTLIACLLSSSVFAVDLPAVPVVMPPALPSMAAASAAVPILDANFSQGIPLVEFSRVVLEDVLKKPFIFSSEFLGNTSKVGFSTTQLKKAGSEALLRSVLADNGFVLQFQSGYFWIKPIPSEPKEEFLYRVKHRDLSYLSSILAPLFPNGTFTGNRGNAPSGGGLMPSGGSGGAVQAHSKPVDSGSSMNAYSNVSTNLDTFLFYGTRNDIKRLEGLLAKLDIERPKVMVSAFFLEAGRTQGESSAVQLLATLLNSRLSITVKGGDTLGNALSFTGSTVTAVASAIGSDSSFNVMTVPAVLAKSEVQASMSVSSNIPTAGAIQTSANGTTTQSTDYREVGNILRVTPTVLEDVIDLQIQQEVSDAVGTQAGVTTSPTINKRSLSTTLTVGDDTWIILGGLTYDKSVKTQNKLFFLPIGASESTQKTDLVILLHVKKV